MLSASKTVKPACDEVRFLPKFANDESPMVKTTAWLKTMFRQRI